MEGKYVVDNIAPIGNVSYDDIVPFTIEIKDDNPYPIEYIAVSCGCTKIVSTKEEIEDSGVIKGEITIKNAGVPNEAGNHSIGRVLNIYFDDGEPEFISNDNMQKIANPDKIRERVTITGLCTIK